MKFIVILALVIIVLGAIFLLTGPSEDTVIDEEIITEGLNAEVPNNEINQVTDSENSTVVTYSADGFSPKSIEVEVGTTVTFANENPRGMWVASAAHPTHEVYPEKTSADCLGSAFDACKQIVPGDSWSFTFNEIGEWGYHNHVGPNHRGTIIVK